MRGREVGGPFPERVQARVQRRVESLAPLLREGGALVAAEEHVEGNVAVRGAVVVGGGYAAGLKEGS